MNVITLSGFIGVDPETREAGSNTVTKFRMAVRRSRTVKDGEPDSDWFNVEVWGARGESLAQYLGKGDPVSVTGTLEGREYERSDGTTGYSMDVKNASWQFVPGKKDQAENGTPRQSTGYDKPAARPAARPATANRPTKSQGAKPAEDEYDPFSDE